MNRACNHARKGIVTNQPDGNDPDRPHAARTVCDRPECIAHAIKWVAGHTNETAVHITDAERRARRSA
jgi:hypothetical protein